MASTQVGPPLPDGIKKETTRHPPSLKYLPPQTGDEVEVHCVGTLKRGGQQFKSTREGDQGAFTYKVGQGDVIEGWDLAVQAMRKGEHARFTVAPQFAYGSQGIGDPDSAQHVPPDSPIVLEIELIKCPLREDLFEDSGAIKRELKEGPGARQPRSGDECQITYKVKVEGCGVAMAAQHAMYKLGSEQLGQIAKVIDKALTTMKRGDEAELTCKPSYAFGDSGGSFAGKVATVFLALEQIYEVHDMSVGERDKTVLRKRIKEGDGTDRLHDTAKVKVRVISATAGGEKVLSEAREFSFTAGNGEVCDALEGSVIDMKEGEEAILRCSSSAAVSGGLLGLPEDLEPPIMIHVAVVSFEKVLEKWDLESAGRIERGRARKEVATELYKRGRIRLACHLYELIAELFMALDFFKVDDQPEAAELRRVAQLNRAMCMLKMGNMKTVKELCTSVLKEDTASPKALFRRAKAQIALREYSEAIADLQRLLEVEPSNNEGKLLLREAKRLRKQNDEHQSKTFAKMCNGLGQLPEREARSDNEVVVMPDLEQEYAKLVGQHGLSVPRRPPRKQEAETPKSETPEVSAPEAETPEVETPQAQGDPEATTASPEVGDPM